MRIVQGGKFQTESKSIVHASYAVSLLVSKMMQVSLSNDTVKSRICDMSCNIKSQLLAKVKASPVFAIQLDESVDVENLSQLLVFVRYVHDQSIEEDLLFCRPLKTTTQAADVMQLVEDFFEEEGLDWGKLVGACTDEAPVMMGARSGFAKLLKQKNPKVVTQHCIIHREVLASRTMTQPLKETLDTVIRLVNFVKASALNCRLFRRLCQDLESDYERLVFHTAVRWLSKGDMLNRLVHLLPEDTQFLQERNKDDLKAAVSDETFQCRLAFLADMFSHLNELNCKLQGADSDIIGQRDKVNAFVSKLELWRGKFETGRSATAFPTFARISKTAGGVSDVLKNEAVIHLNRLLDEFQCNFRTSNTTTQQSSSFGTPSTFELTTSRRKQKTLKNSFLTWCMTPQQRLFFAEKSLNAFWATMYGSYPSVAVAALTLLVAFPSTYLCEFAFSSMVQIKTKSRNRLIDLESDLRCAITKVEPNIEALVQAKQMQKSH